MKSDIGRRRSENQDAYGYVTNSGYRLYVVADGMGGAKGGATASAIAIDLITKYAADETGQITEASLRQAILRANAVIFHEGRKSEQFSGMGTTMVALAIVGNDAFAAHVGDSRLYRFRNGELDQLTNDHTLVRELIDSGAISSQQAENHPISHMLTRSLGPTASVQGDVRLLGGLATGDKYLLCCDGLYNMVKEKEILEILSRFDVETAVGALVNLANERGGTDNITVQLIELVSAEPNKTADKEPEKLDRFVSRTVEYSEDYEIPTGIDETEGDDSLGTGAWQAAITEPLTASPPSSAEASSESVEPPSLEELRTTEPPLEERKSSDGEAAATKRERPDTTPVAVEYPPVDFSKGMEKFEQHSKRLYVLLGLFLLIVIAPVYLVLFRLEQRDRTGSSTGQEDASSLEMREATNQPIRETVTTVPPSEIDLPQPELVVLEGVDDTPKESSPQDELIAGVITEASELSIPPPPAIATPAQGATTEAPDQPIDWETEARVSRETMAAQGAQEQGATPDSVAVLSPAEKEEIVREKIRVRGEIADIDERIRLYNVQSQEQVSARQAELEGRIVNIDLAVGQTTESLEAARRREQVWRGRQNATRKGDPSALAREVSLSSIQVKRKKEAYEIASLRYLDAVELWRENPADENIAAQMAALGRELKKRRAELKEAIVQAVDSAVRQATFDVSEFSLVLADLERHRARLHRQIGFVKAFGEPSAEERSVRQNELMAERRALVVQLHELQTKVSDEHEMEIRRDTVLKQLET